MKLQKFRIKIFNIFSIESPDLGGFGFITIMLLKNPSSKLSDLVTTELRSLMDKGYV